LRHVIFRDYGIHNCTSDNILSEDINIYRSSEKEKLNTMKNSLDNIVQNNLSTVDYINFYATHMPNYTSSIPFFISNNFDLCSEYIIKVNINRGLFNIKYKQLSNAWYFTSFSSNEQNYIDSDFEIINNAIVYNANSQGSILDCLSVLSLLSLFLTKNLLLIFINDNLDKIPNSALYNLSSSNSSFLFIIQRYMMLFLLKII